MRFLTILFLLSFISCTIESTKNQIDSKLLDLVSDDLSYGNPKRLIHLIAIEDNFGLAIEKKYDYKAIGTKYFKIQEQLKVKIQSPAKIRPEIISFYDEINLKFNERHFPVLKEIFETINLQGELESMNDTSDYDVVRFKTALIFDHFTQFIYSNILYHPAFTCYDPTVYSTDTINEDEPITFFFGTVFTAPNSKIFVDQINDAKVDISFPLDSLTGISSVVLNQLKKGVNTISGQYHVPSQRDSKYDLTRQFYKVIYIK